MIAFFRKNSEDDSGWEIFFINESLISRIRMDLSIKSYMRKVLNDNTKAFNKKINNKKSKILFLTLMIVCHGIMFEQFS